MANKIIFHSPLPLNPEATSASGIRPLMMLKAFRDQGYEVDLITGYGAERKKCIQNIKKNILNGQKYEFMYSESSTMPTALTEKNHLPKYPLLDFMFFRFCKKHNIEIGLFYRDIYWLFDDYGSNLSFVKKHISTFFYKFDLYFYKKYLNKLYLPATAMGQYLPHHLQPLVDALPPGHNGYINSNARMDQEGINILYIGGMNSHYEMIELFKAVSSIPDVSLTICTRKDEWQSVKEIYKDYLSNNINITHKSGKELIPLYNKATITSLFVKPIEYRSFAAPVKLYEYIGFEKPIISSSRTHAASFVLENDIGWSVNYDAQDLCNLLNILLNNPELINDKIDNIAKIQFSHTWLARSKKVTNDLKKPL